MGVFSRGFTSFRIGSITSCTLRNLTSFSFDDWCNDDAALTMAMGMSLQSLFFCSSKNDFLYLILKWKPVVHGCRHHDGKTD